MGLQPTLENAVHYLSGRCDGAYTLDGEGWNKMDSPLGHSLAQVPENLWTPKQRWSIYVRLAKYRGQLANAGIQYQSIPKPPNPYGDEPLRQQADPGRFTVVRPEPVQPRRTCTIKGKAFVLDFGHYDPAFVGEVRQIPSAKFAALRHNSTEQKVWTISSVEGAKRLMPLLTKWGFEFSAEVPGLIARMVREEANRVAEQEFRKRASIATDTDFEVTGLKMPLRPFQRAGVQYMTLTKKAFCGDEMGLGKSIEAIASVHHVQAWPALVICPAVVKINWRNEILDKWLPRSSVAVLEGRLGTAIGLTQKQLMSRIQSGRDPYAKYVKQLQRAQFTVINYDLVESWLPVLKRIGYQAIIADEAHYLKSPKAKRSQAVHFLCRGSAQDPSYTPPEYVFMLSGTPFLKTPHDMVYPLDMLGVMKEFGGKTKFLNRYCAPIYNGYGYSYGSSNEIELNEKLRSICYIRRNKAEVLTELPDKVRTVNLLPIDNWSEVRQVKQQLLDWVREQALNDRKFKASIKHLPVDKQQQQLRWHAADKVERARRIETVRRINALRFVVAKGKIRAASEWIEDFLASGEKLIVFAGHIEVQETLLRLFTEKAASMGMAAPAYILGKSTAKVRAEQIERFQQDPNCRLIICSIKAGGVGVTLTAASNVAFLELDWTPANLDQAEDRAHRLGQKDSVTAWYLLAENTIDQDLMDMIDQKRTAVVAATEGHAVSKSALFSEMLKSLTKEANVQLDMDISDDEIEDDEPDVRVA